MKRSPNNRNGNDKKKKKLNEKCEEKSKYAFLLRFYLSFLLGFFTFFDFIHPCNSKINCLWLNILQSTHRRIDSIEVSRRHRKAYEFVFDLLFVVWPLKFDFFFTSFLCVSFFILVVFLFLFDSCIARIFIHVFILFLFLSYVCIISPALAYFFRCLLLLLLFVLWLRTIYRFNWRLCVFYELSWTRMRFVHIIGLLAICKSTDRNEMKKKKKWSVQLKSTKKKRNQMLVLSRASTSN